MTDSKVQALATHLNIKLDAAEQLLNYEDYRVCTDHERYDAARTYIADSIWSFNYDFLCRFIPALAIFGEETYTAIVGRECESLNGRLLSHIPDVEGFVDAAIKADGYGHFLAHYDGLERAVKVDSETYYIYRLN